ncbi:hypothetical protein [Psychrobacter sp. I-STPA6b]|uniref:hypothetical protein n=1 Tax=Psychrobacter sp. I-STPA6b TaxID=2585718 RepID=UPI001D0C05F7|nr:hypothetical protein [Psychrobacter sp. I-STPA6b]
MHISKTRSFESKIDYIHNQVTNSNEELYRNIERKFPTAKTNIVQINSETKEAILNIIKLLQDKYGSHIGFMKEICLPDKAEVKKQSSADYFKALHQYISNKIRAKTGATGHVNYGQWKSDDSGYCVIYININNNEQDLASLNAFISELDSESDTYHCSEKQKMLKALLKLFLQIDHIQHLNAHDDVLADSYINLNNDAYYLIDIDENSDSFLYHMLKPKIWVSSENEIITDVEYKKFESAILNADIFTSDEMDTIMLDHLPLRYKHFYNKDTNEILKDRFKIKQISASEGKRRVNYFDKNDLRASSFFYETYLAQLMCQLCHHADIDYTHLQYAPQYRGRPFVTLEQTTLKNTKLVIINAIRKELLEKTYQEAVAFKVAKDQPQPNPKTIEFTGEEAFTYYVEFLKTNFLQEFDVEVCNILDISYETLDANTNYLCIQDPKPSWFKGYWVVDNQETVDLLTQELGEHWQNSINLGFNEFKNKNIHLKFERDTLKILRLYQQAQNKEEPFYTDSYTLLKIHQLLAGLGGEQTKSIQGLHSSSLQQVGRILIGKKKFLEQGDIDAIGIKGYKKFNQNHQHILTKIKTDLMLKNIAFSGSHLNLNTHDGKPMNYLAYAGHYRCYYIKRPHFHKKDTFFASKIDLTIDLTGITITNISLVDTEASVRRDKDFPINDNVFERLYDDGFYMVDTYGNVLTNYTSIRNGRIIASDNKTKIYNNKSLVNYYYEKLAYLDSSENNKVGLSIAKGDDASLYIPFWTLKSSSTVEDFHYHQSHIEGSPSAGMQWLFIEDNAKKGLKTYLTDKNQMNKGVMNKGIGLYNILVKDAKGNALDAGNSTLASLYIHTTNYNINRVNDFSATSVLHAIAKIALTN